jgi:hypothetical protein
MLSAEDDAEFVEALDEMRVRAKGRFRRIVNVETDLL